MARTPQMISQAAKLLKEGERAPAIDAQMVSGDEIKPVKLSDFGGRKLVLYFYPKDNTPGCSREACAFRDGFSKFDKAGIAVLSRSL